jgi:hypothetical protein
MIWFLIALFVTGNGGYSGVCDSQHCGEGAAQLSQHPTLKDCREAARFVGSQKHSATEYGLKLICVPSKMGGGA